MIMKSRNIPAVKTSLIALCLVGIGCAVVGCGPKEDAANATPPAQTQASAPTSANPASAAIMNQARMGNEQAMRARMATLRQHGGLH